MRYLEAIKTSVFSKVVESFGIIPLNKDFGVNYFLPDRAIFGQLFFARPGNFLPDKLKSYGFFEKLEINCFWWF